MTSVLRFLFFSLIVRPVALLILGLNVRHRERLPSKGPALVAANHNSHLDALVLMTLFPLRLLPRLRPVAAADYFLRNRAIAWFSRSLIGIIPVDRSGRAQGRSPLAGVLEALDDGCIVIIFPEGTRGEPERLADFKTGVAHIAAARPAIGVIPVFLHGLGKALPRGEAILVPFFCDAFVGETISWGGNRREFMDDLAQRMDALAAEGDFAVWE